jgi:hypothetical protein
MSIIAVPDAQWNGLKLFTESDPKPDQRERIIEALGPFAERRPTVDEQTLSRYYTYLSGKLSLPFIARYPQPTIPLEEVLHRCIVLELLDPTRGGICDEFDGIFCKTRKGKFEVNLPLAELEVAENSPNYQLIEDYWYWFWNWR